LIVGAHELNLLAVESVLIDGGYTGQPFADSVKERLDETVQVAKRNELHSLVVLLAVRPPRLPGAIPQKRRNRL
jgi:transposase